MSTEAFLLLSLPACEISKGNISEAGRLDLECVTVPIYDKSNQDPSQDSQRDVYLVLRLNTFEIAIDHSRVVDFRSSTSGQKIYTFRRNEFDASDLVLTVSPPNNSKDDRFDDEIETFEGILSQYADLRGADHSQPGGFTPANTFTTDKEDLRGHLVLVNRDNGEIVGDVDNRFNIREDVRLNEKGRPEGAVIIEIPEGLEIGNDGAPLEVFARNIPPEEQDWITKSATIVSQVISGGTSLLLAGVTSASKHYIARSTPSPHASSSNVAAGQLAKGHSDAKVPAALVFLQSDRTRQGLTAVHAVSGKAVKVSSQTIAVVDTMIRRAVGGKGKEKATASTPNLTPVINYGVTPRSSSPSPSLPPPPYTTYPRDEKPALPPRSSVVSPQIQGLPPPLPPRSTDTNNWTNTASPETTKNYKPLSKKARLVLSADLILSTLDDSAKRILDVGGERLGAVVGHKYGQRAGDNTLLMAGTARNVALVYIDMKGVGRQALLKRVGKQYVKTKLGSRKEIDSRGSNATNDRVPNGYYAGKGPS